MVEVSQQTSGNKVKASNGEVFRLISIEGVEQIGKKTNFDIL